MTGITCSRCERPAPVDLEPADGGGDPSLLPVLIPPDGWIGDPDGDGLICCATPEEIEAWMAGLERVELEMQFVDVDPDYDDPLAAA